MTGREGVTLQQFWDDNRYQAFRGFAVPLRAGPELGVDQLVHNGINREPRNVVFIFMWQGV